MASRLWKASFPVFGPSTGWPVFVTLAFIQPCASCPDSCTSVP